MSRPDAPTPRTDAAWDEEWRMKAAEPNSDPAHGMCDFAMQLERELSLAQTEIKGHMRIEDELKRDLERGFMEGAYARLKVLQAAEYELAGAQARIAELEKELAELHREWEADILAATDLRQDAARYRWLRDTMPMTIGSALKWPYYPAQHDYDVFDAKIDAAIDAALKPRA